MCTLTLAWQAFPDAPVVVAANRDEAVDRPSRPPAYVETDPTVFAPLDERAGGTWMGVNDRGVFVGITNRWVEGLAGERSRGRLVRDCLRAGSAAAAARVAERAVREDEYAGFNLVVADAGPGWRDAGDEARVDDARSHDRDDPSAAILLEWDGRLSVTTLDPGVHVVVNVGADGAFFEPARRPEAGRKQGENASRLREALRPEPDESPDSWLERAREAIADHDFGACVHRGEFGTVSSSLVRLNADRTARFEFADGPPCETAFEVVQDGPLRANERAADRRDVDDGEGSL